MDADTTQDKVKELFELALDEPESARGEFVRAALDWPEAVRAEVLALLEAREHIPVILQGGTLAEYLSPEPVPLSGRRIGAYVIDEALGDGGSATVFRARHVDPALDRAVALKILNRVAASEQAILRFQREARVLSALEHPGIVRLYDFGRTEDGVPYFVMELVEGQRIDESARPLSARAVVSLFLRVAEAISQAHRSLVVHRDLKPSNILVGRDGQPKILDFGIALLLSEDDRLTQTGLDPMTLRYASPEQVRRDRHLTTLSDVYALSVLLYELLWKRSPYGSDLLPHVLATRIVEGDLVRPPARLADADLEAIVFKGLSAEPTRRYQSVDEMAADLRNYLAKRPVTARPPSALYRAKKFVARNKLACGLGFVFLAVIVIFVALLNQQREIALRRSDAMTELAGNSLGDVVLALRGVPGSLPAILVLYEKRVAVLEAIVREEPRNHEAKRKLILAWFNLGTVQGHPRSNSLGLGAKALQSFRAADALAESVHQERPGADELIDVCYGKYYLGTLLQAQGDLPTAGHLFETCIERMTPFRSAVPEAPPDTRTVLALNHSLLAVNHAMEKRSAEFRAQIEEALKLRRLDLNGASTGAAIRLGRQLSITLAFASEGALLVDDVEAALRYAEEGIAIEEPKLDGGPIFDVAYYLSAHLLHAATASRLLGNLDRAQRYASQAFELATVISAQEPESVTYRFRLAQTAGELAETLDLRGNRVRAIELRKQRLLLARKNAESDPTSRFVARDVLEAEAALRAE